MLVTKNTYGVTAVFKPNKNTLLKVGQLKGSSLDRISEKGRDESFIRKILEKSIFKEDTEKRERKSKEMSKRTKSKIRKKVIAFARINRKLSFVTLTFCNQVQDEKAIKVLHKFLDNVSKRSKHFEYLWVAERQSKNVLFKNNIHFHLITNKYWKIEKWWKYWMDLQAVNGILPRNATFKPSSSFDVKGVSSNNIKAIANYLTSYVTKNEGEFKCQIWNCSRKVSMLYTDFYDSISFIERLEVLERRNMLGGKREVYQQEYCSVHTIPLNRITLKLYNKIDDVNKCNWEQTGKGIET